MNKEQIRRDFGSTPVLIGVEEIKEHSGLQPVRVDEEFTCLTFGDAYDPEYDILVNCASSQKWQEVYQRILEILHTGKKNIIPVFDFFACSSEVQGGGCDRSCISNIYDLAARLYEEYNIICGIVGFAGRECCPAEMLAVKA